MAQKRAVRAHTARAGALSCVPVGRLLLPMGMTASSTRTSFALWPMDCCTARKTPDAAGNETREEDGSVNGSTLAEGKPPPFNKSYTRGGHSMYGYEDFENCD